MKFGMWTTPTLLFSCSFHAPALLLLSFSPTLAVLLPCSFPAPNRHIPNSSPSFCPVLALFLPSSASFCSALLLPCFCPVCASAPLLLCSSPAPALLVLPTPVWQPSSSSSSVPYDAFYGKLVFKCVSRVSFRGSVPPSVRRSGCPVLMLL